MSRGCRAADNDRYGPLSRDQKRDQALRTGKVVVARANSTGEESKVEIFGTVISRPASPPSAYRGASAELESWVPMATIRPAVHGARRHQP